MTKMVFGLVLAGGAVFSSVAAKAQATDADKGFLTKASQSDFTEIKFSQLAAQKATNPRVKAYAERMVADHTKLEAEMKPIADRLGVTPVMEMDPEHQQKYDALNQLSGMEFDKAYMTDMAQDHHIALDLFKSEAQTAGDPALKSAVQKGEKVVAMHTKIADMAMEKINGAKPPAGTTM